MRRSGLELVTRYLRPGFAVEAYLTPMVWTAMALAVIGAGPLVPAISRWRVSVDAGTTSLLMMLAATGLFIWRPAAIVLNPNRRDDFD